MNDAVQKFFWELSDEERQLVTRLIEEELARNAAALKAFEQARAYYETHSVADFAKSPAQYIHYVTDAYRKAMQYEWRPARSASARVNFSGG